MGVGVEPRPRPEEWHSNTKQDSKTQTCQHNLYIIVLIHEFWVVSDVSNP
jgi:hypothetical protein